MNPNSDNHSFNVNAATTLAKNGHSAHIEKAIILKEFYNLCSWRVAQGKTKFGIGWWYASAANLQEKFPYMNPKSLSRWLVELQKDGFLYSIIDNQHKYDVTKSYTCNYDAYNSISQNEYCISQNEKWITQIEKTISQNEQGISQNEQPIHSHNNSLNNSPIVLADFDKSEAHTPKNNQQPKEEAQKEKEKKVAPKKEKEKKVAPKKEKEKEVQQQDDQLTEQERLVLKEAKEASRTPTHAEILKTTKPFDLNEGVFYALRVFGAARQQRAKSKRMTASAWQRMIKECQKASNLYSPQQIINLIETATAREYQSPFFDDYHDLIKKQNQNVADNQQSIGTHTPTTGDKVAAATKSILDDIATKYGFAGS